jgi:hypothetical protein
VYFTDGTNWFNAPKPNLTATYQPDGSIIYADDLNNRFFYPAQLLYPIADLSDSMILNGL